MRVLVGVFVLAIIGGAWWWSRSSDATRCAEELATAPFTPADEAQLGPSLEEPREVLAAAPAASFERPTALDACPTTRVMVHVVDESGAALADRKVWLARTLQRAASDATRVLVERGRVFLPSQEGRTDAHGECAFDVVEPGAWWFGLGPDEKAWPNLASAEACANADTPIAERFTITAGQCTQDLRLVVPRARYVRGRIHVADGGTFVLTHAFAIEFRDGDGVMPRSRADYDGTFAVGPLLDSEYTVRVSGPYALVEPLRVRPGDDVQLVLVSPATIRGHVIDPLTKGGCSGCPLFASRVGRDDEVTSSITMQDGTFAFEHLAPGAYVVTTTIDDMAGHSAPIRLGAGAIARDIEIEFDEPVDAQLTIERPFESTAGLGMLSVWRDGSCWYAAAGLYLQGMHAVPAGTLDVRLHFDGVCVERQTVTVEHKQSAKVVFLR